VTQVNFSVPTTIAQSANGASSSKRVILGERTMPFKANYRGGGCSRRSFCSCNCDRIKCPIFVG
jgi:hypothetical protein